MAKTDTTRALLCLASILGAGLTAPGLSQDFENNPWRFVQTNTLPEEPLYDRSLLDADPNTNDILASLVDSTYPTNQSAAGLECDADREAARVLWDLYNDGTTIVDFDLSADFIDDVFDLYGDATDWMTEQDFTPVSNYATMPDYRRVEDEESGETRYEHSDQIVNLIGCDYQTGYFSATNPRNDHPAYAINIGTEAESLRDANSLTFQLTAVHELMHIQQYNLSAGFREVLDRRHQWSSEGVPDAIAIRFVADRQGGYSALLQNEEVTPWQPTSEELEARYSRRFYLARPYYVPLNLSAMGGNQNRDIYSGASEDLIRSVAPRSYKSIGYETNGFWTHVMERYLDDDPTGFEDYFRGVGWSQINHLMRPTDAFLDSVDGELNGIEHVLPQFHAEYEGWWEDRVDYNGMTEARWLDHGFNGCEEIGLDPDHTAETASAELPIYAGRCFDILLSAELAERDPELNFATYFNQDNLLTNHLYVSLARLEGADLYDGAAMPPQLGESVGCYELVEGDYIPAGGCLMDPRQGRVRFANDVEQLARTFNISQVGNQGDGAIRIRIIVTYAPSGNLDLGTNMGARDLELVVTADYAELEQAASDGPKRLRQAARQAETDSAIVVYGSRQGRGPIGPNRGGAEAGSAGFGDIFTGGVRIPGMTDRGSRGDAMRAARGHMLAIEDERTDGRGRRVGFLLETPLAEGQTGPVNVAGMLERPDGMTGIQDPDRPSNLVIDEHSAHTLRFHGTVNVCLLDPQQLAMARSDYDPCVDGGRERFAVRGAVGFPGIISGRIAFEPEPTQELEAYQAIRLSRIRGRMGMMGPGGPGGPGGPPSLPPQPAPPTPDGSTGADTGNQQCDDPLLRPDGSCDCSCTAFTCLEERARSGRINPAEMQCGMSCAMQWSQCAQP